MDWFSWLSKTNLEPSLVYEYGLAFAHNEIEEDDIADFDHEFLQSMGVSIAKHRLEILKLAKQEKRLGRPRSVSRLLILLKKTKKSMAKYFCALDHTESSAIIILPKKPYRRHWKGGMLKRNKQVAVNNKQRRLMITGRESTTTATGGALVESGVSPVFFDAHGKYERVGGGVDDGEECLGEEISEVIKTV
ncbi:hypothetical protein ACLOJK_035877 [Asimina triloba]